MTLRDNGTFVTVADVISSTTTADLTSSPNPIKNGYNYMVVIETRSEAYGTSLNEYQFSVPLQQQIKTIVQGKSINFIIKFEKAEDRY